MTERKAISKKTRFEVFKRDGFMCCYCGAHPPSVVLEVDHIKAVANGGDNEIDNLITACFDCNRGKSDRPLDAVPATLAEKSARLAEAEAQLEGYQDLQSAKRERIESECWRVADILLDHFRKEGINKGHFQGIKTFVNRLGVMEVIESVEIAIGAKPYSYSSCFRYFCGICWNKIREGA